MPGLESASDWDLETLSGRSRAQVLTLPCSQAVVFRRVSGSVVSSAAWWVFGIGGEVPAPATWSPACHSLLQVPAQGGQSAWGALNSGMLQVRGGGGASRSTSSEMVLMSLAKGAMRARLLKEDRLPRGLKLH